MQELTVKTQALLKNIGKNPTIALKIDGVDVVFGAQPIFEVLTWDYNNAEWDTDLYWDGLVKKENSRSYISLQGTTKNITQQIYPDKQGSSSISTVNIELIDKNGELSKLFSFDSIDEILGRKADYYMGFGQSEFPTDYITIFRGIIVDYFWVGGTCNISIASPTALQRQDIYPKFITELTANIDSITTTIPVNDTSGFFASSDSFSSLIQIDDEIMEITSIGLTTLTVIRSRENTIASGHDTDTEVSSVVKLVGDAIDLSLKLMLSNPLKINRTSQITLRSFCFVTVTETIQNAVIFNNADINREFGLVAGDILTIDGYGDLTVNGFGYTSLGDSYYLVSESLPVIADISSVTYTYRSKYNVLSDGLGMETFQVDVEQFESIKDLYSPNFINYSFILKDGLENARDFIESQLMFPSGLYSIPRNAKASVKFLAPPLSEVKIRELNSGNILNLNKLKIRRSAHKYLYNRIYFEYGKSTISDKYTAVYSVLDTDSTNRIEVGKKQLKISSEGYTKTPETKLVLEQLKERFLTRLKFAATYIEGIELNIESGFDLEIGDVVFFGGNDVKMPDFKTGVRELPQKLYEVINKNISLDGVKVDLLDTGFATNGLYGLFSPSAIVESGSTTTELILGFDLAGNEKQYAREYFEDYIGQSITVRLDDYSVEYTTTIIGIDSQDKNKLIIDAIPTVAAGMIVEFSSYQNITDPKLKLRYTFMMRNDVITQDTNISFSVSNGSQFFVGQNVNIHSDDYLRDANAVIQNISGNVITLETALPFAPQNNDIMEQLDYQDQNGYNFL